MRIILVRGLTWKGFGCVGSSSTAANLSRLLLGGHCLDELLEVDHAIAVPVDGADHGVDLLDAHLVLLHSRGVRRWEAST